MTFCTKSKITYREFIFHFKDGSQGFWETQSGPILRSYFAHRGPVVGGCSAHKIAIRFPKTLSQHPETAGYNLGLCLRVFVPVSGRGPASSVWVPVCRGRCIAFPGSCIFAFSGLQGTFLAPHRCSPFHKIPCCSGFSSPPPHRLHTNIHTHKKPNPHSFSRLVQACQDPLCVLGHYVHSSLIQGHMRFGSQKTRLLLSTFDF